MKKSIKSENDIRKELFQLAGDVTRESLRITSEIKERRQSFQKEWGKWNKPKDRLV